MGKPDQFDQILLKWIHVFMRRSMHDFTKWMREKELSRSQVGVLMLLHAHEPRDVTSLGQDMDITTAASSQLVERLVQMELLVRKESPTDRRVKQIALSEAGKSLLQEGFEARTSWMRDVKEALSEQEKESVGDSLNILIETAKNLGGDFEEAFKMKGHGI